MHEKEAPKSEYLTLDVASNVCHQRYNEPCSDACESRGETYYWCNTGSTWDYCSPAGDYRDHHHHHRHYQRHCHCDVDFVAHCHDAVIEVFKIDKFSVETVEKVIGDGGGRCVGK